MLLGMENTTTVLITTVMLIVLATAVGAVAGDLWVLPRGRSAAARQILRDIRLRLWKMLGLCLIAFTLINLMELVLRTSSMSELPIREAFSEINTVLLKTHYGHLWLWRCAALLLLWISWGMHWRNIGNCLLGAVEFIALAAIAVTISTAGHAGDDGLLSLSNIANSLHILGAFLWGGGIIATTTIILPALIRGQPPARAPLAAAGLRLSTLAGVALAMVVFPGVYNAWLQIDSWHGLWATTYGQVLVLKLILVAGMVALGAANRFFFVPGIQTYSGRRKFDTARLLSRARAMLSGKRPFHSLRDSLRIEAMVLLGVLFLAAALSQQTPAIHAEHEDGAQHNHGDH